MSACDKVALSKYLDGDLGLPERRSLEAHVSGCASCARELKSLEQIDRLLAQWSTRRTDISERVEQRIARSVSRRSRRGFLRTVMRMPPAAVGTSVAAVLVLLSANLGLLYHQATPGAYSSALTQQTALERQSRPLLDARRSSAILAVRAPAQVAAPQANRTKFDAN